MALGALAGERTERLDRALAHLDVSRVAGVQRDGRCWMGATTWQGRRAMRISVSDLSTTFDDVDASSLAFFRISFGVVMLVEVWRFVDHGWIERYFIDPEFMFKYFGFGWVQPWPGDGMY